MTQYNNIEFTKELLRFIEESPSCYHTTAAIARRLDTAGFTRLSEAEAWELRAGGNYYVIRAQASVIAFRVPERENFCGFNISASHGDYPCFKIKELGELARTEYTGVNTESYGGSILSSWLDRPLSVAGRLICRTENGISSRLFDVSRDLLLIPNTAPHLNKKLNCGYEYNMAVDMVPLLCTGEPNGRLKHIIAKAAEVDEDDILGADMYLYNRTPGRIWGAEDEFFSSRSIDDLQCAYSSLCGFLAAKPSENCMVYCCFDNEEVGSATKQGAGSTFLYDILRRINSSKGDVELTVRLASSFLLSCDNAHALHPNHPELTDAKNRVVLGGGVVLKFNANMKYTTDGISEAFIVHLCRSNDIPLQYYANRSDIGGGSTLGGIATTRVSINSADVGLPQLAMHSSYETASTRDSTAMARLCEAFFSSGLISDNEDSYRFG